jgi:hypothetical protein
MYIKNSTLNLRCDASRAHCVRAPLELLIIILGANLGAETPPHRPLGAEAPERPGPSLEETLFCSKLGFNSGSTLSTSLEVEQPIPLVER